MDTTTIVTKNSDTKILSTKVNYRKENTKDTEIVLNKTVSRDFTNTMKVTTVRSKVETKYNSKIKDSASNNSDSNTIKGAAGMLGEFIGKILK